MLKRIHNQFGTAGLALSVIAIVLALAGGAIAANNSASASKAGPRGPRGKTGPAGPAGPAGTNGTNGKDGAPGAPGSPGAPGANGNSVLHGTEAPPANTVGNNGDFYLNTATSKLFGPKEAGAWPASGTSLKGAAGAPGNPGENGKTVLNGTFDPTTQGTEGDFYINTTSDKIFGPKTGAGWGTGTSLIGAQGEPGETGFTSTLPSGKTETGTWGVHERSAPSTYETWTPISFPIPLEKESANAFFVNALETEELEEHEITEAKGGCKGPSVIAPTAPPGKLCVYTAEEAFTGTSHLIGIIGNPAKGPGYISPGAYLDFSAGAGSDISVRGTWAVTAP